MQISAWLQNNKSTCCCNEIQKRLHRTTQAHFSVRRDLTCQETTIPYHQCFGQRTGRRGNSQIRAQKKSKESEVGDWAALAVEDESPDEEDPEFQASINQVCNRALRLMLDDNTRGISKFQEEELNKLGEYCTNRGNMAAATFVYVLYKMTDHVMVKQTESLEGMYKDAFEKIFSVLEDSGWLLREEGEEGEEGPVPDELLPSVGSYY